MSLQFTTLVHQSLVNQCLHVAYVLCPMSICASRQWPRRMDLTSRRWCHSAKRTWRGAHSKSVGPKMLENRPLNLKSWWYTFVKRTSKKNDLVRMTRNVTIMSHVYFYVLANVLDLFFPYNHIFPGKSWGNEMKWEDVLWVPCLQQLLFSLLCPLSLPCDALAAAGHLRSCSPTGLQQWSFRIGNVLKTMP